VKIEAHQRITLIGGGGGDNVPSCSKTWASVTCVNFT
jgi:hypothetical protein